ncbi:MAG: type 4a pilus biogenesis protein PilO [Halieaceae bacterium]|jgi:type IV pilus assembly protein PilO|nr:type 4a pilus biogenesis protein PilO [Halieaceae bacterium]
MSSFSDSLRSLNELDLSDLDFENVGSWPQAVKVIAGILLFAILVAAGYYYHVEPLLKRLEQAQAEEVALRRDFEKKAFEAANLEAYKRQMVEMEESFGALVSQLPSDTEVPGLLEDISNKGEMNGLKIEAIDLLDEETQEFYIELPIAIKALGSYHDLGAFISGMAGLPRIVTLHDFAIAAADEGSNRLEMNITAKTYRYRDGEGGDEG